MKQIENPFPGLRPYQAGESHLFFGRENHIDEILDILGKGRFVCVVGNSGSGKSSLIRAGIVPKLHESDGWIVSTMRPGNLPIESLANALSASFANNTVDSATDSQTMLKSSNLGLLQICRPYLKNGKKLLLLVDQFEELFRFRSTEDKGFNAAVQFADLLVQSIEQKDLPIYIMISLRSDFLGDCEQFTGLPEAINKGLFLIPRLNTDELKMVITGPVKYAGAKISPVLVQKLTNEVGNNPDQLPVLQHVLMRTWEVWNEQGAINVPIDEASYLKTGGVSKALSNHAEEAFSELTGAEEQKIAEQIFKIITFKGSDNRGVRRPTSVRVICQITRASEEQILRILDIFRSKERGFIMPPFNIPLSTNSIIDISHESLMRVWERLKDWSDDEAESAELYLQLANSALLYERDKGGLLHDPDLQLALDWYEKNTPTAAWAAQYNPNFNKAVRFLKASEQHRDHLRRISTRNRRLAGGVVALVIVMLSVLSLWAFSERQNSLKSTKIALAEKLKAQDQKVIAENQTGIAKKNLILANAQEARALAEQAEAEKQKNIAILKAEETRLQKLKAERASLEANDARMAAELDRKIAESEKRISDELREKAEISQKNATRLRILSIAQAMAINSRFRSSADTLDDVTLLMAMQAYKFNLKYGGDPNDPGIYDALNASLFMHKELKEQHLIRLHVDAVKSVLFEKNGYGFMSCGDDGNLIFQQLLRQGEFKKKANPGLILNNLAVNTNNTRVAYSADNNKIYIQNRVNLNSEPIVIPIVHDNKITSIHWTNYGIVSSSLDNTIRLIDPDNFSLIKSVKLSSRPLSMAWNQSKNLLAVGCDNGAIFLLQPDLSSEISLFSNTGYGQINSIDFNTEGSKLIFGSGDGICGMYLVDKPNIAPVVLRGHTASITTVKFNPLAEQMASAGLDGKVVLWRTDQPESAPIVVVGNANWINGLSYSSDGKYIAFGGKEKFIRTIGTSAENLYLELKTKQPRDFTKAEWQRFVGSDIPYEPTIVQ